MLPRFLGAEYPEAPFRKGRILSLRRKSNTHMHDGHTLNKIMTVQSWSLRV